MVNTTIAIPKDLKKEIEEFGFKGETYSEILARLLKSAKERQLQDILMDEKGFIPIEDAIKEAEKKWPK